MLHERALGREADLKEPQLRAALVAQLSEETHIHPDFIDGYLEAAEASGSLAFETQPTQQCGRQTE